MARRATKAVKRRLVLTVPITITVIVIASFSTITELIKIEKYKKEERELTNKLENLKKEAEELNIEITKLNSPDYIARYAREKYLYTKDGEKVVIVDVLANEKDIESYKEETNYLIYALIISGVIFLILIIGLISKIHKKSKKN